MSRRYLLILSLLTFFACKKENPHPQWDIDVLGPILHGIIGINQLIGDTSIIATPDGAQILNFEKIYSGFKIDSIYAIADTTIPTVVVFPNFPATLQPGQVFYANNNNIALSIGDVALKRAIISSGKIRLSIKNTLQTKVLFTYTIPKAVKNGQPFTVNASVDSASVSSPKFFTGEYDFTGYDIDLTGATGNLTNSITYNVNAQANPAPEGHPFNVAGLDTMINLNTTLVAMKPSFVKGYLGQESAHENQSEAIDMGRLITGGTLLIDSAKLNLDIYNYVGADIQANIPYLRSLNSRTGNSVDLISSSVINHYLNMNRAYINPSLADSVVPSVLSIMLDNNNSNLKSLVENIPDSFNYDINLNFNPLGNVSGNNDFVFSDRLLDTKLHVQMPLRFALNQLELVDTLPLSINNATDFDQVGPLNLTLIADNGFPFDLNFQLFLLDEAGAVTDSLLVPDLILSAPYDASYKATGIQRTKINIPVDEVRKKELLSIERIRIRLKFNTPDFPQLIQFYTNYRLELKLVADGTYSIR